jgi:hypothetical protein
LKGSIDMDHADSPEHGESHGIADATPSAGHPAIPEEVWKEYRAQDLAAARYIIGLMAGIFILGLLLYTGVALWVEGRVV